MGLWPISSVAPCITYEPWDGVAPAYNPYLVTPPRVYQEAINGAVWHYFYEPGNDRLVAFVLFDQTHWPGWAAYRYEWDAGSGAFLSRTTVSMFTLAFPAHAGVGSYGAIYTTWNTGAKISEVSWKTLTKTTGMWEINPASWTPAQSFAYALVNRQDELIVGVDSWYLQIWDVSGVTPLLVAKMRLPGPLGYLAWESRKHGWISTSGGLVAKLDYQTPRWEMLSSVQDPSPDALNYLVAFDTKRHRLAVFRQRPDATDGACQCQLEFYRPICKVAGLTDPVPLARVQAGVPVPFLTHLYGDRGEGITPYVLEAALEEPVTGLVLTPVAGTGLNGAAIFRYQSPEAGEDTLTVSATITDGE